MTAHWRVIRGIDDAVEAAKRIASPRFLMGSLSQGGNLDFIGSMAILVEELMPEQWGARGP